MGLPQNARLGERIWKTWKIITGKTERQLETPQNKTKQQKYSGKENILLDSANTNTQS